jgi:Ca2+-binding EF-hand superfamily protein
MERSFASFDLTGSGYISADDLEAQLARIADAFGYPPTSAKFAAYAAKARTWSDTMRRNLDKNAHDRISRDEYTAYFSEATEEQIIEWCEQSAASILTLGDDDEDGQLSRNEYVRFRIAQGGSTLAEAEAGFAAVDNGSGYVTRDDFIHQVVQSMVATEPDLVAF